MVRGLNVCLKNVQNYDETPCISYINVTIAPKLSFTNKLSSIIEFAEKWCCLKMRAYFKPFTNNVIMILHE